VTGPATVERPTMRPGHHLPFHRRYAFVLALAAITLVGLVVRLLFAQRWAVPLGLFPGDERFYQYVGVNLANGDGFTFAVTGVVRSNADHPPGQTVLHAALSVLGIEGDPSRRAVLAVIVAPAVFLTGLTGRRLGGSAVGLVAAAIAAAHPLWIQVGPNLWPEGLYLAWISLALYLAARFRDRPGTALAAGIGAVIALAGLTRSEGLLFIVVLGGPLVISAVRGWRRRLAMFGAMAGVMALVLAPWLIRNYQTFGDFTMSTQEGDVIAGANCATVYEGDDLGSFDFDCWIRASVINQASGGRLDQQHPDHNPLELAQADRAAGVRYATEHADRLPIVASARVLRTWSLFGSGNELVHNATENRNPTFQQWGQYVHWFLLPWMVVGSIELLRFRRSAFVVAFAGVAVTVVTSAIYYGNVRFRVAAEPSIALLAAVGVVAIAARLRGGRRHLASGSEGQVGEHPGAEVGVAGDGGPFGVGNGGVDAAAGEGHERGEREVEHGGGGG